MAYSEQKSDMSEMVKIKKADNSSIWKDIENIGAAIMSKENDRVWLCKKMSAAKRRPVIEAQIAKILLQAFASRSLFLKNNDPTPPVINSEIKAIKVFCSIAAVVIGLYLNLQ